MFALKVTRLLEISLQNATTNELNEETSSPVYTSPRQKRSWWRPFSWVQHVFPYCYKWLKNSGCKGLCGIHCFCWPWICGDCCYHRGCYDHDVCCEEHGYFHWRCIIAYDVLLCDSYHSTVKLIYSMQYYAYTFL